MLTSNVFEFCKLHLVFEVCASMPASPPAFTPPGHFWVFECFLVAARALAVVTGQDPSLPGTLVLFFPLFTLSPLCNFHPPSHIPALLQPPPQSSSPPETGSEVKAALQAARTCFPLPLSTTERLGHNKAPEPACSHGLLCTLSLPSRDGYKKPFSPRVGRFSPRITHGSLLWDL